MHIYMFDPNKSNPFNETQDALKKSARNTRSKHKAMNPFNFMKDFNDLNRHR